MSASNHTHAMEMTVSATAVSWSEAERTAMPNGSHGLFVVAVVLSRPADGFCNISAKEDGDDGGDCTI